MLVFLSIQILTNLKSRRLGVLGFILQNRKILKVFKHKSVLEISLRFKLKMITYNDIYEALRKEKYAEPLQPLDRKFVEEVAVYLKEKQEIASKTNDIFSEEAVKTKKQLENAVSIFRELITRRKKKLLNLAFIARETGISKRDFDNMLELERNLFEKITKGMEESEKCLQEMLSTGQGSSAKNLLVLFKDNTDEFLNTNGEMMGPFEKGEIANLPEEIARILVESGKAELAED